MLPLCFCLFCCCVLVLFLVVFLHIVSCPCLLLYSCLFVVCVLVVMVLLLVAIVAQIYVFLHFRVSDSDWFCVPFDPSEPPGGAHEGRG